MNIALLIITLYCWPEKCITDLNIESLVWTLSHWFEHCVTGLNIALLSLTLLHCPEHCHCFVVLNTAIASLSWTLPLPHCPEQGRINPIGYRPSRHILMGPMPFRCPATTVYCNCWLVKWILLPLTFQWPMSLHWA